ncbi:PREDICTED: G-protein coupled receptor 35-like [Poecilia mexicana]|uniref:G-protein coupled receptors family 1 profile domain-containing protein n=1 Tax=Poecilia mexicana TaxID=48701 RepID=A0A3B3XTC9_9TELE|nr:PREDICTED: G-protein coupled receptor 35-like [Poecilia mexicana]
MSDMLMKNLHTVRNAGSHGSNTCGGFLRMKFKMCSNDNTTTIATSNTTDPCVSSVLEGLGYSLVFLLGLVINGAALWAFVAKRASWTDTHIYMLNLALADFILVLFLPFRIYDAFFCLPKTRLCTFLIFIHFTNMYASILTTTAVSLHRYLTIRFPLQARSWKRRKEAAVAVCLLIWVGLVLIVVVFRNDNHPEKLWSCYERCKNKRIHKQFTLLLLSLGYLAPLLIIVFCSSQIIRNLGKELKSEERKSIVGIIKANMIVFLVCYTPIHIAHVVSLLYKVPQNWRDVYLPSHTFLQVSEWIASTNCCFDSISYYFLLKTFYAR